MAGASQLVVGEHRFDSRLVLGTGKYSTLEVMDDALAASGTQLVTVAIRRVPLDQPGDNILKHLDGYAVLPNTAGCFNAEETVRTSRLARELLGTDLLKLEVLYDQASLLPEPPWHYSGDMLTLEYRTDPDAVAELLPDGIEPAAEDPGAVAVVHLLSVFPQQQMPHTRLGWLSAALPP